MTPEQRLTVAFHETGHVAMVFFRGESMHETRVKLHADRFGGQFHRRSHDVSESDLMMLIGGPMAEFLSQRIVPKVALRFSGDYRKPNSDSFRIRALVRNLCDGKDDRAYQFEWQERCREIQQEPRMWAGITKAAARLAEVGELDGEEIERILTECGAVDIQAQENRALRNLIADA
jgi:hypothetical protein